MKWDEYHIYMAQLSLQSLQRYYGAKLVEPWYLMLVTPCCVFYATRHQIYRRFEKGDTVFASTLIWYHTHRQTHLGHTGTNRVTNTEAHNVSALHLQKSYICWLDSTQLGSSCETQRILIELVQMSKIHTTTQRKIMVRPSFLKQPPYLTNPSLFY